MADPWLTIIGIGEDGLSSPARAALDRADSIFGGPRHLELAKAGAKGREWPVPFDVAPVLAERGRQTVVLASGDPFWFGAGSSLVKHLVPGEWTALPAPSTFCLAASRLGWRLEETHCLGLHATPFERLVPVLSNGVKAICLVRDGAAAGHLAHWLDAHGSGQSALTVLEALGGPRERMRTTMASDYALEDVAHPVAVAIDAKGSGGISRASGLADDLFAHDGQITKRPVRALNGGPSKVRSRERPQMFSKPARRAMRTSGGTLGLVASSSKGSPGASASTVNRMTLMPSRLGSASNNRRRM